MENERKQNRNTVNYTICVEAQLPEEVKNVIQRKREKPFQFTYSLQEYRYIVIGYGQQHGGGYSIRIDECSEDEQHIFIDTTLLGSEESLDHVNSYPYIVVRCRKSEKNVIFL